jgi:hypothetical protein
VSGFSAVQILQLVITVAAALAGWAAFVRAGRWRDSDDGKAVKEDIHSIKNELTSINARLNRAEAADKDLPAISDRLTKVETTLESVATIGDFRELKADMAGMNRSLSNVEAATRRIESWLVESGK